MAKIQLRRGDASDWTTANSVLAAGEVGLEMDTGKFKWGDGTTAWNDLAYIGGGLPDWWTVDDDAESVIFNGTVATELSIPQPATLALGMSNGVLFLRAVASGSDGNEITIEIDDPGADNDLSVAVVGNAITVTLGYADGAVASLISDVFNLLDGDGDVTALIETQIGEADGLCDAVAETPLAGGSETATAFAVDDQGQVTVTPPADSDSDLVAITIRAPIVYDGFNYMEFWDNQDNNTLSFTDEQFGFLPGGAGYQQIIDASGVHIWTGLNVGALFNDDLFAWGVQEGKWEFFTSAYGEPADEDVATGTRLQWFDDTPGAMFFGIKQRDSDGTLVQRIAASYIADGTAFAGLTKPDLVTSPTAAEIATVLAGLELVTLT